MNAISKLVCRMDSDFLFEHCYFYCLVISTCFDVFPREKPAMPSNILSLSQLRTLPLADQIKALLTNGKSFVNCETRFNSLVLSFTF